MPSTALLEPPSFLGPSEASIFLVGGAAGTGIELGIRGEVDADGVDSGDNKEEASDDFRGGSK